MGETSLKPLKAILEAILEQADFALKQIQLCAGGFRTRGLRTLKINQPKTLCNLAGIFVASQGGFQLPYEVLLQRIND
jgi:hypothetical protein